MELDIIRKQDRDVAEFIEKELDRQGSGNVNDSELATIGKEAAAKSVVGIVVRYNEKDKEYYIQSKVVDVESNTVIFAANYPDVLEKDGAFRTMDRESLQGIATILVYRLNLFAKESETTLKERVNDAKSNADKASVVKENKYRNPKVQNDYALYRSNEELYYHYWTRVKSDMLTPLAYQEYIKYKDYRFAGGCLTGFGVPIMAGGISLLGCGLGIKEKDFNPLAFKISGGILSGVGLAMLTWGIIDICVGNSGLERIARGYNEEIKGNASISLGPQRHGYGLAINF